MSASRLTEIIENNSRQGRLSKIPFLSAAFPQAESFWNILADLDAHGADIIEIGVPFSDPIADGPVVAEASQRALENGGSLDYIFTGLDKRRAGLKAGIVLMGYVNPFIQYGWEKAAKENKNGQVAEILAASLEILADKLKASGVDGLIVPDLPLDENGPWVKALGPRGVDLIALVGPNTSLEKMKLYAQSGVSGYVYVVSVMGITGVRQGLPPEVADTLKRAREAFDLPLALGFGLSSPEQLAVIDKDIRPEGAVFGSALIKHLDQGGTAEEFMAVWNR